AAAITVDDLSNTDGGGTCTLRNAITAANTNAAVGGCPAGTAGLDTIHFSVTGTVHIGVALPALTEDVTIDGPGADTLTISVDDEHDVWRKSVWVRRRPLQQRHGAGRGQHGLEQCRLYGLLGWWVLLRTWWRYLQCWHADARKQHAVRQRS